MTRTDLDRLCDKEDWIRARSECRHTTCAICGQLGTRVGLLPKSERLTSDALCHDCFESAPTAFKLPFDTAPQHSFRAEIKAGAHPRIARRRAEVQGCFSWPRSTR